MAQDTADGDQAIAVSSVTINNWDGTPKSPNLPLYIGACVSMLKETSIVGYIAIQDLTRASDLVRSRTFDAFIPLGVVTILYFVVAWVIRTLLNLALRKKQHD